MNGYGDIYSLSNRQKPTSPILWAYETWITPNWNPAAMASALMNPGATCPAVRISITVMLLFGFSCPDCRQSHFSSYCKDFIAYPKQQLLHYSLRNKYVTEVSSSSSHGWFHTFLLYTKSFLCAFFSLKINILFFQRPKPLCKVKSAVERGHSRSLGSLGVFHVTIFFLAVSN